MPAESLLERFVPDTFDLVFSRNALDHTSDPLRALQQMLAVVKPGHSVLLEVHENEADAERYGGMRMPPAHPAPFEPALM